MEPTTVLPIVAIVSLVTVESGGAALLKFLTGGEGPQPWQRAFFRAGHAHAGVLLVLVLVYLLYLPRAEFSDGLEWAAGGVLTVGTLAQSGGFFVHMAAGEEGRPSRGTTLTRIGGGLIAVALITLAVGLVQTA
jgi:hypothetical protein